MSTKFTFFIVPDDDSETKSFSLGKTFMKFLVMFAILVLIILFSLGMIYLPQLSNYDTLNQKYAVLVSERVKVLDLIKKFPHLSGISISSAFHYNYYKGIFDRKLYTNYKNRNVNFDIGNTEFIHNHTYPKIIDGFSIKSLKKRLKKNKILIR